MSDALYERYKDALRRGHVAALRGRLDEALAAYREAARHRAGPGPAVRRPRAASWPGWAAPTRRSRPTTAPSTARPSDEAALRGPGRCS